MKKKSYLVFFVLLYSLATAQELQQAIQITNKANLHSIKNQNKIDSLVIKKEKLYSQFQNKNNELKSLNNYNKELKDIIDSQQVEHKSILKQITKIDETKREILPLIKNMLVSLNDMIQNDTPFLYKERTQRIKRLQKLIKKSDISIATKYRAIIEAYEIETEYSRTIETYNDILEVNGLSKNVKLLRVGRIALYYVTENNKESAIWDRTTKKWFILDTQYIQELNNAIKIASKKSAPNFLNLPLFSASEDS